MLVAGVAGHGFRRPDVSRPRLDGSGERRNQKRTGLQANGEGGTGRPVPTAELWGTEVGDLPFVAGHQGLGENAAQSEPRIDADATPPEHAKGRVLKGPVGAVQEAVRIQGLRILKHGRGVVTLAHADAQQPARGDFEFTDLQRLHHLAIDVLALFQTKRFADDATAEAGGFRRFEAMLIDDETQAALPVGMVAELLQNPIEQADEVGTGNLQEVDELSCTTWSTASGPRNLPCPRCRALLFAARSHAQKDLK